MEMEMINTKNGFIFSSTDVIQMSGDDFEQDEDVFEAVGGFLQECDVSKSEEDIK